MRRRLRRHDGIFAHPVQTSELHANFLLPDDPKPMTVRFDIINLFDTVYQIRSGSGIGVFAPQYGPRRGFFAGVSKKF